MKIAINSQYGGFGLSSKAVNLLFARGSQHVKIIEPKCENQQLLDAMIHLGAFALTENGEYLSEDFRSEHRDDPLLIAVIEELGQEADGPHARLKIVEIPGGVEWKIEEYDGAEWVAEKHRTWQ